MAQQDQHEDYDISNFIDPERIEDPTSSFIANDAPINMRVPAGLRQPTIRRNCSPNLDNVSSASQDDEVVFTPETDVTQHDYPAGGHLLASPTTHFQQPTSSQLPWSISEEQRFTYDDFTEEPIFAEGLMDTYDEFVMQPTFVQQDQMQLPDRTTYPMGFQPVAYVPMNGFVLASNGQPMQPVFMQQPAMPILQHHHHMGDMGHPTPTPRPRATRPARPPQLLPASQPVTRPAASGARRGVRGSKLNQEQRKAIAEMRNIGACWRCVIQRDPVSKGWMSNRPLLIARLCVRIPGRPGECERCDKAATGGPTPQLPCDRTKLPMLIGDFLPASMQNIHQKQVILDDVKKEVRGWQGNITFIALSPGFGPDFTWDVYEFVPSSPIFLRQTQYFTDSVTRELVRHDKYSPPFGVLEIGQEDRRFSRYMDTLLDPTLPHLHAYARQAYASEFEDEPFEEKVLVLLVDLYRDTRTAELQNVLKKVLRLMILTFIMGHTLTIPQHLLPGILNQLQHRTFPVGVENQQHTSPRLANRQLKFYFSILRNEVYSDLLKLGQTTLRAGKKDETWMLSFVMILGLAMVNEEIQGVLHLHASGSIHRQHVSEAEARGRAYDYCDRIDSGIGLLIVLFQHKYRSDKWTSHGSFGNQTPIVRDPASAVFLHNLRHVVDTTILYLQQKERSEPVRGNHFDYTTRLTARFLMPFTRLPVSGS